MAVRKLALWVWVHAFGVFTFLLATPNSNAITSVATQSDLILETTATETAPMSESQNVFELSDENRQNLRQMLETEEHQLPPGNIPTANVDRKPAVLGQADEITIQPAEPIESDSND